MITIIPCKIKQINNQYNKIQKNNHKVKSNYLC